MRQPSDREIELFNAALELPDSQRAAYLDESCGPDDALRRRVEELLIADDKAGGFLDSKPGAEVGPGGLSASKWRPK